MNKYLRWVAVVGGIVIALVSVGLLISGSTLEAASERGTLIDASGVAPSAEMVAAVAQPRIVLGIAGVVQAVALLLLVWVRSRAMVVIGVIVSAAALAALVVVAVIWPFEGINIPAILPVAIAVVLTVIVTGSLLRARLPAQR